MLQSSCFFTFPQLSFVCLGMRRALYGASAYRSFFSRVASATRGGEWRTVVALLVFCTFFLQADALQTHIHGAQVALHSGGYQITSDLGLALDTNSPSSGKHKTPSRDDPADCPLCQAAFYGSAVFSAVPIAAAPSAIYFVPVFLSLAQVVHAEYLGHDREQRGPPKA